VPKIAGGQAVDIASLTKNAKDALGRVESDERVVAAIKLLQQTAQEIAAFEQSRVLEMKRHLAEINRLRADVTRRDHLAICLVLVRATGELYPALAGKPKTDFETAMKTVMNLEVGAAHRYACRDLFPDDPALWAFTEERKRQVQADWTAGKTLAGFVAKDVATRKEKATAPALVAALGILLFHEREFLETVRWDLAREHHRHSIRLSRVNTQERAQLVSHLSQALEVYYQGGVKPEAIAELVLLAGQVGALTFIGVQQ
jgi:hypothetical protein